GNACTRTDSCQWGVCVGNDPVVCASLDQCHDPGKCDSATGLCSNPPKADGTPCNDGTASTSLDSCQAGVCGGTGTVCRAIDQCHNAGTCNPTTGVCSNPAKPNGTSCSDSNACTTVDTCQAGTCVGTSPVVCVSLDQCHDPGTCDPVSGTCSNPNKPNGSPCDDGNPNTVGDTCQGGVCTPGGPAFRPQTCRAVRDSHPSHSLPDGAYTIYTPAATTAWCDMNHDGGGWTAVFIGTNGSPNVFDHFDAGSYLGTFNDATGPRYLQRAPSALSNSASELAVSCGSAMVKFPITIQTLAWLL